MSGTGKSSALAELARRGLRTVDTDEPGWNVVGPGGEQLWDEEKMARLLAEEDGPALYVSGTVRNQGRFYDRFDEVVLFSAPREVILERIAARTTNNWGKTPEQHALILEHIRHVEPLLRATCTREIDTSAPLLEVVDRLVEIGLGS